MQRKAYHANHRKQHEARKESRRRKRWSEYLSLVAIEERPGEAGIILFKASDDRPMIESYQQPGGFLQSLHEYQRTADPFLRCGKSRGRHHRKECQGRREIHGLV